MHLLFLSWYNAVFSSISLQAAPQPKTKEELQEWIKECDGGVKNHGEPNTWDVTLVTDMSKLFKNMENFNAPIDQWNTSEVTDMNLMFACASSFNQPITMDTSKVINMYGMFQYATSFNSPITMDTSKVTDMDDMFFGADAMTHPKPSLKAAGEEKEAAVSNFFFESVADQNQK